MIGLEAIDQIPARAGAIGLFSSDEFLPGALEFDRALLAATGPEVAVLFCADHRNGDLNARHAARHFAKLGARPTPFPVQHHPARADKPLPSFDLLYLPGGSPAELLECLRGTNVWRDVEKRWRAGMGLAGSSAGAMALSSHCMVPRPGDDKPTTWGTGLGPLQGVGLAVHATSRSERWLTDIAAGAPVPVLAIDDATGVLLCAGMLPQVIGSGRAWVVQTS